MSVFSSIKDKTPSKVHSSEYLLTADQDDSGDTKPAEPTTPTQPEAK